MAVIDQSVTWKRVEERLATETDPVLRRNLELVLDTSDRKVWLFTEGAPRVDEDISDGHVDSGWDVPGPAAGFERPGRPEPVTSEFRQRAHVKNRRGLIADCCTRCRP